VVHFPCAQEALAHLRSPATSRPALILLDLSLPGTSGLEFIQVVKDDPCLRNIPIVVLTGSNQPCDIHESFDLGIAGYMVKSARYDGLVETIRAIQNYWSLSQFPTCHSA
jgi:CheY-like chemotaxis protein